MSEAQIRRHVRLVVIDGMSAGDWMPRDEVTRRVYESLKLHSETVLAWRSGNTGTISWGVNKALRHFERVGTIRRGRSGAITRVHPDPAVDIPALLAFLRMRGPVSATRVQAEAPPMPHLGRLGSLHDVGLAWRVGNVWYVADPDDLDSVLVGMAITMARAKDAEVASR